MTIRDLLKAAGFNQEAIEPLSGGYGDMIDMELLVAPGQATCVPVLGIELSGDQVLLVTEGADLPY